MFPYVIVFGQVPQQAIHQLADELVAFDEVYVELDFLRRLGEIERLLVRPPYDIDERLAANEELVSTLFDGRNPEFCAALMASIESLSGGCGYGWTIAERLARRVSGQSSLICAIWHPITNYLKLREHPWK